MIPKVLEKWRQNLIFDILRLHTISGTTLFHDLKNSDVMFILATINHNDRESNKENYIYIINIYNYYTMYMQ